DAFPVGPDENNSVDLSHHLPIQKELVKTDNQMTFLVEKIPYLDVALELQALPPPPQDARITRDQVDRAFAGKTSSPRSKPIAFKTEKPRTKDSNRTVAMTAIPYASLGKGYLADYSLITGTLTDQRFYAGQTYYVTGTTYLQGNSACEGASCIKFAS